ncbi:MAG: FAD-dependent oxidoreductase [Polyangiaceae bacterium]
MNPPRVVVIGTGFGGLESAFYLRKRLGENAQITLVGERAQFEFRPNTIYIPFGKPPEAFSFPLGRALERRSIPFVAARISEVDTVNKVIRGSGAEVPYDYLVIATGAKMRPAEIPGLSEHALGIWSPEEMLRLRAAYESIVAKAGFGVRSRVVFLVPQNNKWSGPLYEMALMLDTWLRRRAARDTIDLSLVTHEGAFIQSFGPRVDAVVAEEFKERNIHSRKGARVERIDKGSLALADGEVECFDLLVTLPPYVASTRFTGLPSDERGFIPTQPVSRQVEGHPDVYVVGDAGDFPVKQAFLALQQADVASEHLAQRIFGEPTTAAFDPVSMCIVEQLDKATFAQVPLELTHDARRPVSVREDQTDVYRVGTGVVWRMAKKLLGTAIPQRFTHGLPFHAGPAWTAMEAGVKVMAAAFSD